MQSLAFHWAFRKKMFKYIYMPPIGRVSSATLRNLGAYDTREERLARVLERRRHSSLPKRRTIRKMSLPTSLERRMPGAEDFDGFRMTRRQGRGRRRTMRRKKRTRNNKRKKRRNTRR